MSNNIDKLVADMVSTGLAWYCEHAEHVHSLVEDAPSSEQPGMPSLDHKDCPERWNANHWMWWFTITNNCIGHLEDYHVE